MSRAVLRISLVNAHLPFVHVRYEQLIRLLDEGLGDPGAGLSVYQ